MQAFLLELQELFRILFELLLDARIYNFGGHLLAAASLYRLFLQWIRGRRGGAPTPPVASFVDLAAACHPRHPSRARWRRQRPELCIAMSQVGDPESSATGRRQNIASEKWVQRQIGRASCRKECRSRWSPYH